MAARVNHNYSECDFYAASINKCLLAHIQSHLEQDIFNWCSETVSTPRSNRARMCEIQDSLFWEKSISQDIDISQKRIIVATWATADGWEASARRHSSLCLILDDNGARVNNNNTSKLSALQWCHCDTSRSMFILTRNKYHSWRAVIRDTASTACCASGTVDTLRRQGVTRDPRTHLFPEHRVLHFRPLGNVGGTLTLQWNRCPCTQAAEDTNAYNACDK